MLAVATRTSCCRLASSVNLIRASSCDRRDRYCISNSRKRRYGRFVGRGGLMGKDRDQHGYFFVFPEVPENSTPETNPLMANLEKQEFGDFSEVTKEDCGAAVLKLALDYEASVWQISEKIRQTKEPSLELLKELETSAVQFETVWSILNTLYICKGNEFITETGYRKLIERARIARNRKFTNESIYYYCKELSSNKDLPASDRRLVDKFVLEGKLSGIELTGNAKEHYSKILTDLVKFKDQYRDNLEEATRRFQQLIVDPKYMGDMPSNELKAFAKDKSQPTRAPWTVRLGSPMYENFMRYCPERALRWNTWLANVNRSSGSADKVISNSVPLEEIRSRRRQQASVLGFDNYVQFSMLTKMAGTPDNVQSMIATLHHHAIPAQKQELAQLQTFAESRGFEYDLQQWDVEFYRRKEAKSLFQIDHDTALADYFSYPTILHYLFKLCSKLFSIEIVQAATPHPWHPSVEYYKIIENGKEVGSFFIDPYERKGKQRFGSWLFGNQCKSFQLKPLATLVFNFPEQLYGKPSLLSFSQVETLFQKFGSLLQHILTKSEWSEVNGQNNIEWDSLRVPDYFLSLWLTNEAALADMAVHWDTGERLSGEKVKDIVKWRKHFAGFDLSCELYKSALDVELHSRTDFWKEIAKSLYPKYNLLPMDKSDSMLCSFSDIFVGGQAAAYYSSLWSRMLAADIYRALIESPDSQKEYGRRFRESYLALGGSQHPGEVFRLIRGRDPSPESLLWSLGLDQYGAQKAKKKSAEPGAEPVTPPEDVVVSNPEPIEKKEKLKKRI